MVHSVFPFADRLSRIFLFSSASRRLATTRYNVQSECIPSIFATSCRILDRARLRFDSTVCKARVAAFESASADSSSNSFFLCCVTRQRGKMSAEGRTHVTTSVTRA